MHGSSVQLTVRRIKTVGGKSTGKICIRWVRFQMGHKSVKFRIDSWVASLHKESQNGSEKKTSFEEDTLLARTGPRTFHVSRRDREARRSDIILRGIDRRRFKAYRRRNNLPWSFGQLSRREVVIERFVDNYHSLLAMLAWYLSIIRSSIIPLPPRFPAFSSKHESAFFNFRRRPDIMPGICVIESIVSIKEFYY